MKINREKAKNVFNGYVDNYDINDEKIRLKIYHTYKVCENCERLARRIGLGKEAVDIAWLIGLLHDIGRFEQARVYGTFNDLISIDHGKLGVEILFSEGMIREFIQDEGYDGIIRAAIEYHNDFKIPDGLSEECKTFCNILRDADKIDIFRVNITSPLEEIYNVTTEEIFNSSVTEEVMNSFRNKETILRKLKKTAIDNVVGHIALVFGLKYDESIKIAGEQGYLKKLLDFQSNNSKTKEQFREIKKIITEYIEA